MNKLVISPKILRLFLIAAGLFIAGVFLYWIRSILIPFFLAFFLAYVLNPAVEFWQEKKLSRSSSILLTYLLLIIGFALMGTYFIPIFWRQLDVLMYSIPTYTRQVHAILQDFYADYQRIIIPESLRLEIDNVIFNVEQALTGTMGQIISGLLGIFSHTFSIIISPVLAFYILLDQKEISRRFLEMIPVRWRWEFLYLWQEIDQVLMKFVRGHLLVALLVGLLTSTGFFLIGLDFPFLLGMIAGLADIIPYFGPIIGAIPALALAILHSKKMALSVLVVMVVVQQLESNIISPKVLGSSVGLHPLTVIFVLLLGGKLYGVLGMLLAVPAAAIARILLFYFASRMGHSYKRNGLK
ncbi:MAG: AI-2E family transporter [Clostridia bacterium]|nr:AI-2E family transporter [Clostridia bacterium]